MKKVITEKLLEISSVRAREGRFLQKGTSEPELHLFRESCKKELGVDVPEAYAEFLRMHNGLVIEGVFIYSTERLPLSGSSGKSLAFIEMNLISRELDEMKSFLVFGDSDQDEYVLDISSGVYQVRDKQAFDNIYEEFQSFDDILEFILDMILRRIE